MKKLLERFRKWWQYMNHKCVYDGRVANWDLNALGKAVEVERGGYPMQNCSYPGCNSWNPLDDQKEQDFMD